MYQSSVINSTNFVRSKLEAVQALRGISAFIVLLFHITCFFPKHDTVTYLFRNGPIGVLLFFMISGFLMAYTTQGLTADGFREAKVFLSKRIIRIVPLYYIAVFAMIIVQHKLPLFITSKSDELVKTLLFLPQLSDPVGPGYGIALLYVGWSLNYEMFFYFLFGFSLLFDRLRYVILFTSFCLFMVVLPLLVSGTVTLNTEVNHGFHFQYLNFATNPIIIFFVVGVAMGVVLPRLRLPKIIQILFILTGITLFILYYFNLIVLVDKYVADLVFCTVLVFALILIDLHHVIRIPKLFVFMGDISYPVYLLHPIILIYARNVFIKYGFESFTKTWTFYGVLVGIVVVVSYVSHIIIEKKFTQFLRHKIIKRHI